MRKFKRIYHAVLILTVIFLLTVSKQIGAINFFEKKSPATIEHSLMAGARLFYQKDTVPGGKDSVIAADTTIIDTTAGIKDTTGQAPLDTFTLKLSKDTLSAPVTYTA